MKYLILLLSQAFTALLAIAGPLPIGTDDAITGVEQRDLPEVDDQAFTKRIDIRAVTDEILFSYSIDQFKKAFNTKTPRELIWDGFDGCTKVPDLGFKDSCRRHDFGFANYRKQNRLCPATKKKLDDLFCKDMRNYCNTKYRRIWQRPQRWACNKAGETYCAGVKLHKPRWSPGC